MADDMSASMCKQLRAPSVSFPFSYDLEWRDGREPEMKLTEGF